MTTMEEDHHLVEYLNDKLPTLSLDPETYIPYITGCLNTIQIGDEDGEEEFAEIIALLQASSESHSDDEDVWKLLSEDILTKHAEYIKTCQQQKELELLEKKEQDAKRKEEEMIIIQQEAERRKLEQLEKEARRKADENDPAKRALLNAYAYDQSEKYDEKGNLIEDDDTKKDGSGGGSGGGEETVVSNKAYADKVNRENANALRAAKTTSKVAERQKTKEAKKDKMKQKEERRKRAQKGERKR